MNAHITGDGLAVKLSLVLWRFGRQVATIRGGSVCTRAH